MPKKPNGYCFHCSNVCYICNRIKVLLKTTRKEQVLLKKIRNEKVMWQVMGETFRQLLIICKITLQRLVMGKNHNYFSSAFHHFNTIVLLLICVHHVFLVYMFFYGIRTRYASQLKKCRHWASCLSPCVAYSLNNSCCSSSYWWGRWANRYWGKIIHEFVFLLIIYPQFKLLITKVCWKM